MKKLKYIATFLFIKAWLFAAAPALAGDGIGLRNPLNQFQTAQTDPVELIQTRLGGLLSTMFGIIAILSVFPVVMGGFDLITSQGNPQQVEKGKKTLTWGLIGMILGLAGIGFFGFFLDAFLTPAG